VDDDGQEGFHRMSVVHICLLVTFKYGGVMYPCALVEWFKKMGENPDSDEQTGMGLLNQSLT
jgi:hypothetical protein